MERLDEQVAVVTGGASGIGQGIARRLAADGARVVVADMNADEGERLADSLGSQGADCMFVELDSGNAQSTDAMTRTVLDRWQRYDILCANVGIYPAATLTDMSEDEWDLVQRVNLKGAFLATKAAIPHMVAARHGRVVVTSSVTGPMTGYPGWSHYGATKAGLLGFIRSAALEVVRDGVTMNAVCPGNVHTEGFDATVSDEYRRRIEAALPIGRLARPEDVAHAVRFFVSEEAAYITGQTLVVDGGQILPEQPLDL
jgi:3-oxoacyl-[acyl-carrier protein] reductase